MLKVLLSPSLSIEEIAQSAYAAALAHGRKAEVVVGDKAPEGYAEIEIGAYDWRLFEPDEVAVERILDEQIAAARAELERLEAEKSKGAP